MTEVMILIKQKSMGGTERETKSSHLKPGINSTS